LAEDLKDSIYAIIDACHNPSLRLMTKARACKGAGQAGGPRITSRVPRSVGKCEGMTLHTPKGAPTLGIGVLVDSRIFRERLHGSKPQWIEFFISLESSWNVVGNHLDLLACRWHATYRWEAFNEGYNFA
jgi:hypothetical protein